MPLCALCSVAAEPRNVARAIRRVRPRSPKSGRSLSISYGRLSSPSMSESMTDFQSTSMYWASSLDERGLRRDRSGHDQRRVVLRLVQSCHDGAHQPQHASGSLEPLEGRPVLVQPVEQLRVDRIGRLAFCARTPPRSFPAGTRRCARGRRSRTSAPSRRSAGAPARPAGSKSRRRTISNDSCADAGCHWCATRPTTFSRRRSAALPCSPPVSRSDADSRPPASAAVHDARRSQGCSRGVARRVSAATASVSVWAKVNWVSNVPPGRAVSSSSRVDGRRQPTHRSG